MQSVQVGMGEPVLILAFVVVVIGGIGSIRGALRRRDPGRRHRHARPLPAAASPSPPSSPPAGASAIGAALASMLDLHLMALVLVWRPTGLFRRACLMMRAKPLVNLPSSRWPASGRRRSPPTLLGEPFYVTLATRVAILGLAGAGLNLALGYGGLVSFGHAAFFGIGGYAAGILAIHASELRAAADLAARAPGTTSMPVIWLAAVARRRPDRPADRRAQPAHRRRLLHHDHARLRADDLLLRHLLARLRRRGRPVDLRPQRLSGRSTP